MTAELTSPSVVAAWLRAAVEAPEGAAWLFHHIAMVMRRSRREARARRVARAQSSLVAGRWAVAATAGAAVAAAALVAAAARQALSLRVDLRVGLALDRDQS